MPPRKIEQEVEPIVTLATRLPQPLHRRLQVRCVEDERTIESFVREALEEHLGRLRRKTK